MKQTILHPAHEAVHAKMAEFQGWQVPQVFTAVQDEYQAVRAAAGLFDIGFLGRLEVRGPGAEALLQDLCTIDITKLPEGSCRYGLLCNTSGTLFDDPVIFHLASPRGGGRYLLTSIPMNTGKVAELLRRRGGTSIVVDDRSAVLAHLALQGPKTAALLESMAGQGFRKLKPRAVRELPLSGIATTVARTGSTGEHVYELIVPAADAPALWEAILQAGRDAGVRPCGFAVRDILRTERGRLLYGIDIDESRTPIEAGLSSFIDFRKNFAAKEALLQMKDKGRERQLAGFALLDKGLPKTGSSIYSENREIGVVTSAVQSPALRTGIGLGYVARRYAQPGQEIEIEVREREVAARIVELPFFPKKK